MVVGFECEVEEPAAGLFAPRKVDGGVPRVGPQAEAGAAGDGLGSESCGGAEPSPLVGSLPSLSRLQVVR